MWIVKYESLHYRRYQFSVRFGKLLKWFATSKKWLFLNVRWHLELDSCKRPSVTGKMSCIFANVKINKRIIIARCGMGGFTELFPCVCRNHTSPPLHKKITQIKLYQGKLLKNMLLVFISFIASNNPLFCRSSLYIYLSSALKCWNNAEKALFIYWIIQTQFCLA